MKTLLLLVLLAAASNAAQPAPVYRSPTVLTPKHLPHAPSTAPLQAEERESPAFPTTDPGKSIPTTSGVQPMNVVPPATAATVQNKDHVATPNEQVYRVMYFPITQAGYSGYQPLEPQYQTGYQAVTGVPVATAPANDESSFLSNIDWKDWLVGASSLAMIGLGSALLYPNLPAWKQRAMRELSEMNSEDAARMARTVMKAISRISEINNAGSD